MLSIYKLEGVCLFVPSFETFGSGSFGGPLRGPVGFGGPLVVRWVLVLWGFGGGGGGGPAERACLPRRGLEGGPRSCSNF